MSRWTRIKSNKRFLWLFAPAIPILLIIGFFFFLFAPYTVQKKSNPTGTHQAKLLRVDGFDVIFKVVVDGEQVYSSPDFAPIQADFREQIVWDATGKILVFEVAGQRIFGYNAEKRTVLTDNELLQVNYLPFFHYGYEGKLPQQTK